jgi:hypothetical protein
MVKVTLRVLILHLTHRPDQCNNSYPARMSQSQLHDSVQPRLQEEASII